MVINLNIFNSFIITTLAGIATLLGYFVIYLPIRYKNRITNASLSFASGVMITISIFDLIPESFNYIMYNDLYFKILLIILFITIGVCFSIILNRVVDSNNYLYRIGIVSLISIVLHNIPEGIITFITANNNTNLGLKLGMAIAFHNIPEGISIAVPLYYSTKKKGRVFIFLLISALSEPIGALIGLLLNNYINNNILGYIYSIIVGLMLYISIYEILPLTVRFKKYFFSLIFFLIGVVMMLTSFKLFN